MKKYATVELSTKKKVCDTESINMWIWNDEPYRFTDFFEYYIIMTSQRFYIGHLSSDLKSEYQI